MLTWDTAQYLFRTFSGDSSDDGLTAFKTLANLGYKEVLHTFNGEETEDVRTWEPSADDITNSVRGIKLPPNYIRIHSVTATIGSQVYPVLPIQSQERWNKCLFNNQTANRPTHYFIRPRFGTGGSEILFDPIPSTTDLTITINYGANARDLEVDAYTTGTISLNNANRTLTGSGTTFTTAMVGRYFKVDDASGDGMWYRITAYASPTSLSLENKYDGSTISGKNYKISEAFYLPEDLQMAPVEYAMWYYYLGLRKDARQADKWGEKYIATFTRAQKNYKSKDKGSIVNDVHAGSGMFEQATPNFWPQHASGS